MPNYQSIMKTLIKYRYAEIVSYTLTRCHNFICKCGLYKRYWNNNWISLVHNYDSYEEKKWFLSTRILDQKINLIKIIRNDSNC